MPDVTEQFEGLRGASFVEAMRALALIADAQHGFVRCGAEGCPKPAEYIGMQRCGAPGGPVCADHLEQQKQWMSTAADIADVTPYCRHCDADIDRSHIYAVGLWDGREVAL